jgi:hypothetical protein
MKKIEKLDSWALDDVIVDKDSLVLRKKLD